ncbi:hypothetical protein ElyMa_004734800 [Elysia marginata]|uniref:Uncharacterized protein n=1 Tax=Elysia marginata TaxID=1093978 RepID=A0AAV4IB96_9GAST|nr:hypothetical protein ElyMa_004734800 [Elysia marginata]
MGTVRIWGVSKRDAMKRKPECPTSLKSADPSQVSYNTSKTLGQGSHSLSSASTLRRRRRADPWSRLAAAIARWFGILSKPKESLGKRQPKHTTVQSLPTHNTESTSLNEQSQT